MMIHTRQFTRWLTALPCAAVFAAAAVGNAQTPIRPAGSTGSTQIRSIHEASAVDKYRRTPSQPQAGKQSAASQSNGFRETSYDSNVSRVQYQQASAAMPVRQAAMLQANDASSFAAPTLPPNQPGLTPSLPTQGFGSVGQTIPSSSDLTRMPTPQLSNSGFATINNCPCVSAPSSYSAASGIGCGSSYGYATPVGYQAPPAQIASPAVLPPGVGLSGQPLPQATSAAPAGSLFTLGQQTYAVQVGQGLWGQPVAYVPGQGVRNWIRYMFP